MLLFALLTELAYCSKGLALLLAIEYKQEIIT